jgi:hypothetical protein
MDITVAESDRKRAPGHLSRQGPPVLRWALYEAAQVARQPGSPDRGYYEQAAARLGPTAPACRSPAGCFGAASTPCASWARRRSGRPSDPMRARARHQPILRGRLPACSCRHGDAPDGPERQSGRTSSPSGDTPSTIMSPAPRGPRTEMRLGARAHRSCHPPPRAHAPPRDRAVAVVNPDAAIDAGSLDRQGAAGDAGTSPARGPGQSPIADAKKSVLLWRLRRGMP